MTADLLTSAQAGNSDAFRELTEPFRRELQVHCYRMLGSFQDAEDVLQDTMISAWQGLPAFESRAQRVEVRAPTDGKGVGRHRY